ncbi:unnamed protein product [Mytilus edulis]|uniref:Uncharacterized protein n=1 Tax=Mytilus edulis TaxID=6550 RepID=A0A8S3QSZ3_MYTED|nr:unnamed protein product [Mytilus edulis]
MCPWSSVFCFTYRSIEAMAGIVIGCLTGLLMFITVTVCVCKANRKTAYGGQVTTTTNRRTTVSYTSASNRTHIQPHAQLTESQVNGTVTCEPSALENGNENSSTLPPSYASVMNNPALYQLTGNIQTLCVTQSEHAMTTQYSNLTPTSESSGHNYNPLYVNITTSTSTV